MTSHTHGKQSNDVAKAAPDGYTLLWGAGSMTESPALYHKLPFDVVNDFAPISLVVEIQNMLMVPAGAPWKSVRELVAAAKATPGKLNYASSGSGATPHLSMELLKSMAGVDIAHIPYKGDTPALTDLLAGRVDMYFATVAGASSNWHRRPSSTKSQPRCSSPNSSARITAWKER